MDKLLNLIDIFCKLAYKDPQKQKEYMRDYMASRYHSTRNRIIEQLGGECIRCGAKKGLHLDHIDKKKKQMNMADAHSVSDKNLKKELKNIQLLCSDCHKTKTHESWDYSTKKPRHGTYWMYRKYKCRCSKCTKAYKKKVIEWRTKEI